MLSAKGLVRSRPKLGTFVREPHDWNFLDADILRLRQRVVPKPVFLRELFAVRRMVEPETAALSAVNATPAMLAKMQIAVLDMARGGGAYTHETIEGDVAFHRLLLAASGNALLSGLGACIEEALRASISITSHPDVGSRFALDKHLAVFEAVCDGNPGAARNNMIALLDMTEDVLDRAKYGEAMTDRAREGTGALMSAPADGGSANAGAGLSSRSCGSSTSKSISARCMRSATSRSPSAGTRSSA